MEIITMESSAYKELVEKIDKIAGYVRDSEREKKKPDADVWLCNEEVMSLLGISRRTLQRLRDSKRIATRFSGVRAAIIFQRCRVWSRSRSSRATRRGWKISDVIICSARAAKGRKGKRMGLLETETFELWMSKIMERFDRHEQMLSKLAGKEIKEVKYLDGERLLDNQDLCQLLQASKRSLQRYRSSGTLRYQMLWHKIYYKESDVQEFLKNHFDEFRGCRKVEKKQV